eukprot:GHUV01051469.1.p1 GENE.GHUV01051469.1~~GHUV01051469.1.p1  ORF type:complete len:133 (+),score=21.95 GHUV01051469.1:132-530(+)
MLPRLHYTTAPTHMQRMRYSCNNYTLAYLGLRAASFAAGVFHRVTNCVVMPRLSLVPAKPKLFMWQWIIRLMIVRAACVSMFSFSITNLRCLLAPPSQLGSSRQAANNSSSNSSMRSYGVVQKDPYDDRRHD